LAADSRYFEAMNIVRSTSNSFGLLACACLFGCSASSALPRGTIALLTGQEAGVWSADPPAATVRVEMVAADVRTTLAEIPAPTTDDPNGTAPSLTLGSGGPQGVKVSFEATAFDDQQNPVMHGVSSAVTMYGFDDAALYVFLGRSGFARPLGALENEHRHPLLSIWPNAFVFITGSDSPGADASGVDTFDVALGSLLASAPALPQVPTSSASTASSLLLVGDAGSVWLDLTSGASSSATAPSGLAFSELVGGRTLLAAGGAQYLVGATRSTPTATDKVLRVDSDGSLHALQLATPRLGAAAGFVSGNLVVVGGSSNGAGAEVLAPGATSFAALDLPADETVGAGLAQLNATTAILVAGKDPKSGAQPALRTIDLSCAGDCAFSELAPLAPALTRAQAFPLSDNRVLVVGETDDGETHAWSLDASGANPLLVEQAFRERRAGASAALLPNGQVLVVGGDQPGGVAPVSSIELFFP
jgi:hypothetical protein